MNESCPFCLAISIFISSITHVLGLAHFTHCCISCNDRVSLDQNKLYMGLQNHRLTAVKI